MKHAIVSSLALAMGLLLWPHQAHAGDRPVFEWQEADWRLELSALTGFDSGSRDRVGDYLAAIAVDYELPFTSEAAVLDRSTFSFRLRPLMYYYQDDFEDHNIFAAGAGLAFRIYQHKDTKTGFFAEIAEEILGQSERFAGNSSNFNFLNQGGVGYQSKNRWFVTLRVQHASNAGLSDHNAGVNSVGLAAGWRF